MKTSDNDIQSRNIYDTKDKRNVIYQHRPTLYTHYILPFWIILSVILGFISVKNGMLPDFRIGHDFMAWFTIVVYLLCIIYFFLVTQNMMYVIVYQLNKSKQAKVEQDLLKRPFPSQAQWARLLRTHHRKPKVALIYCTYNDFLPDCLYQCMKSQTYPVDVKILDDSSKKDYQKKVDKFQSLHKNNVQIIRRHKHPWDKNKAGNLNHGLKVIKKQHYDFYLFLDSDELLSPNCTRNLLKEFYYGDYYGYHVGLIQCTHHSGRNTNRFMKMNALSAKYFWNTVNMIRSSEAGVREPASYNHKPIILAKGDSTCANLGHGCMADSHALYASGMFPNVVSEDVASTVNMIEHGYNTYFSTQIMNNEETVTDMNAMKVRSNKFANGDLQWVEKYFKPILRSKMESRLQKLDTIDLMGSTNMSGFLFIALVICSIWYPLDHSLIGTSPVLLIPIILFLYSSGIIDTIYSLNYLNWIHVIIREFEVLATFSSTYFLTVKATYGQLVLHHKAKFNVTPKSAQKISIWDAFKDNLSETIFSLAVIIASFFVAWYVGHPWMSWLVLLAYVPPCFSFIAELMVNHQTKHEKKLAKIFKLHQHQALTYVNPPTDEVWENWKA